MPSQPSGLSENRLGRSGRIPPRTACTFGVAQLRAMRRVAPGRGLPHPLLSAKLTVGDLRNFSSTHVSLESAESIPSGNRSAAPPPHEGWSYGPHQGRSEGPRATLGSRQCASTRALWFISTYCVQLSGGGRKLTSDGPSDSHLYFMFLVSKCFIIMCSSCFSHPKLL